jgi:hypothetical protein
MNDLPDPFSAHAKQAGDVGLWLSSEISRDREVVPFAV